MNRLSRTTVPSTIEQRRPRIPDPDEVREKDEKEKKRQKENYDSHHGAKEQRPLTSGEMVWLPDKNREGRVTPHVATMLPQEKEQSTEEIEETSCQFQKRN